MRKTRKQLLGFVDARAIALALPGVEEGTSYGTAALKVGGKLIARMKEDGETLVVKVDLAARDALVEARPDVLFVTDHYRAHPWILVRLGAVRRLELAQLLEDAWAMTASKRHLDARVRPGVASGATPRPSERRARPVRSPR